MDPFVWTNFIDPKTRSEFERLGQILRDPNNPLKAVVVITNNEQAKAYFESLMREYGVSGIVLIGK